MSDYGITGFGAYVPRLRLARAAIADAHHWANPALKAAGKGERAFCSWDEDTVTMAVEAARDCLTGRPRSAISSLRLASTTFPYADLSSGVIAAAALGLGSNLEVANCAGSQRAATTALIDAFRAGPGEALVIASERPVTLPGGQAEIQSGAGAAALTLGTEGVVARLVGSASNATYFVDHFRAADQLSDYVWEERWIRDEGYAKLVPQAVAQALTEARLEIGDIAHLVLPSPVRSVAATLARQIGFKGAIGGEFEADVGYCGAAHGLLGLAEVLAVAGPGEHILLIGFGQGVDALILETSDKIVAERRSRGVAGAVADRLSTVDYLRMLSFYGKIDLDSGMRGEKIGKAALTEQYRSAGQLNSFTGGRCGRCGTLQFPVLAYCVNPECLTPAGQFAPVSLADEPARIFTVTTDWLSYHPAPPLAVGFVQFDAGARLLMEIVDAPAARIVEGEPLKMVFRIKERDKIRGFNRYFWKATPISV